MSVFSKNLLEENGLAPSDILRGYETHLLIEIPAEVVLDQSYEQVIRAIPSDDEVVIDGKLQPHPCNVAHVEIIGRKGKALQKMLRALPFPYEP
jgi:hypothetical protein